MQESNVMAIRICDRYNRRLGGFGWRLQAPLQYT